MSLDYEMWIRGCVGMPLISLWRRHESTHLEAGTGGRVGPPPATG